MKILAIEHSTAIGNIVLLDKNTVLQEISWQQISRKPSTLIEQISKIINQQNINLSDIDIFAVGLGPGIYSNLRISLSAINGLAIPEKKPVYGISSAAAIAQAHIEEHDHLKNITIIGDARRDRVWYAPFTVKNKQIQDNQPYQLIAINNLSEYLKDGDIIISPDWDRLSESLASIETKNITFIQQNITPNASTVGKLAQIQIKEKIDPIFPVAPIYIHPPVFVKPKFPSTNEKTNKK